MYQEGNNSSCSHIPASWAGPGTHGRGEAAKDQKEPSQGISARFRPSTGLEKGAEVRVSLSVFVMGNGAKAYPSHSGPRANLQPQTLPFPPSALNPHLQGNVVTWITAAGNSIWLILSAALAKMSQHTTFLKVGVGDGGISD